MKDAGILQFVRLGLGRMSGMAAPAPCAAHVRAFKLNSVILLEQPNPIVNRGATMRRNNCLTQGGNWRRFGSIWRKLRLWAGAQYCPVMQTAREREDGLWAPTWAPPPPAVVNLRTQNNADPAPVAERTGSVTRHATARSDTPVDAPTLSESQLRCAQMLCSRAELFFQPPAEARRGIPIQTNSLIVGPAGSGKTTVARYVADSLGADFLHLSHGSWIVEGSHDSNSTIRVILWRAAHSRRLVVFFDELDKLTLSAAATSDWEVSLRNDLWLLFDRALSWGTWATKSGFASHLPAEVQTADALELMFKSRVFLVAAGTWQNLHRPVPAVGFAPLRGHGHLDGHQLNRNGGLPEEMLRRFNQELVHLEYPEIPELEEMLERDGLLQLAKEQGVAVDPAELRGQMDLVGMTALTSLKTSLLLRRLQKLPSPRRL